mgnify:CR=1 FL=1
MKQINNLSKSDNYLKTVDLLARSVETSLNCPPKVANAIAKLISAKIYLELVCEEEEHTEYLLDLEDQLRLHHVKETIH